MKKIFFLFVLVVSIQASAQCNTEALCNTCVTKLTTGFNFLKTYKINSEKDLVKVEYSYVFAKGTQYMITLCNEDTKNNSIMVTIYDAQRNRVASNKIEGKLLPAIAFPCNATGIYYLQYTFEGNSPRCGGSALGFKR